MHSAGRRCPGRPAPPILLGHAVNTQFESKEAVGPVHLALSIDDSDPEILAWAAITSSFVAADRLLVVDPTFTMSAWTARGGQANAKLLIEGLRKAGLSK